MYLRHFGLAQYPFSLNPNTRFFFKLKGHELAFAHIVSAIEGGEAVVKITGEVGTGKTMLCRKTLNALDAHADRYLTAFLPHPILSETDALLAIADEFRFEVNKQGRQYDLLKTISSELLKSSRAGKHCVLFIDEAQAMPEETLQVLALMAQLSGDALPLQIILFGQPELDQRLDLPALRQLSRQIKASYSLPTLSAEEMAAYIEYRLAKAGHSGGLMERDALEALFNASAGVPRLINILCHKALLVAYGKGKQRVGRSEIEAAVIDTESLQPPSVGAEERVLH